MNFTSNGNPLGSGTLTGGVATLNTTALPVGVSTLQASFPGNGTFLASVSSPLSFTVSRATPGSGGVAAVTVTSSLNPSVYGQNVTFTAAVPSGATGTVTFADNGSAISSAITITGTTAAFTTSSLLVGTHPITAVYSGDSNYNGATSASLPQVVSQASGSTVLTVNPSTVMYGDTSTLTAVVSPAGSTGTVTFTATPTSSGSAITLGASSLNGTETAVWPESALSAGAYNLVAHYNGDQNFGANSSPAVQLTVTQRTGSGPNGAALTVTANDASRTTTQANPPFSYTASGTLVNGDTYGSAVTGTPAYSAYSGSTPGTYPISITSGLTSANYVIAFAAGTLTVVSTPTTTTLTASPGSPQYGDPVTLTASISPGAATGSVSFYDGSIYLGAGTVSGGAASLTTTTLNSGTHPITAIYNGDGTYASSGSSPVTVTVAKKTGTGPGGAALTVTVQNASRQYGASNPQFVYVVSGMLANGDTYATAVTGVPVYSVSGTPTSPVGSTFPITVSGLVSQNYVLAFVPGTLTIVPAATSTGLNVSATSVPYGNPVTLTATVTPGGTGTVAFVNGSTVVGQTTLSGGVATLTTTTVPAGTYVVTATYLGDGNYSSSTSGPVTLTVTKRTGPGPNGAALTVTVNNATRAFGQGNPAFSYTVTGTLVNNDTYATAVTGVPVFSTPATVTSPVGNYPVSVTGLSSANYVIGFVNGTLAVTKGTPAVILTSSLNPSTYQQGVTFTATLSAGATGTVGFQDGTAVFCNAVAVADSTANCASATLAAGTHPITAVYSGDSNYNGANSTVLSQVVVNPADFAISATTPSQIVSPGAIATYTFHIMSVTAPFTNAVTLTASGLPAGSSYTFTPASVTPGANGADSTLSITVPKQSALMRDGSRTPFIVAVLLLPLAALGRSRRRLPRLMLWLLLTLPSFCVVTGCGVGGYFNQPEHTYVITVSGTSGSLVHSTTVTLTVQ